MTSTTGTTAPIHRRFNEEEAAAQVRNRYKLIRDKLSKQLDALQQDPGFCQYCDQWYNRGYKDWMIISAVYNVVLNVKLRERMTDYLDGEQATKAMQDIASRIIPDVYPSDRFMGDEFTACMYTFNIACLRTWGFHPRLHAIKSDVIESFLRKRMRHFDIDLPHKPIFGTPPGEWPVLI
ncbi:MAG: hypothetical protein SGJ19_14215 [Planctomycetia bacterium]|nr:hypothetical protein [Planctomycetia bacterium]